MRKNRKMPRKMSVVTESFMHVGAVLFTLFIMVIVNIVASTKCVELERDYVRKEEALKKLDDEFLRETARWEEMKTNERINAALKKHGLAMDYPTASQTIRMGRDGLPRRGQVSVAKLEQRKAGVATASYSRRTNRRR